MKIKDLLIEFAGADAGGGGGGRGKKRRGGGDGDDNFGTWKQLPFGSENVYYNISLVSMQRPRYGLQIQLAVEPHSANAECETARDESVDCFEKSRESLDGAARKLALKWLKEHGTEPLHKARRDWRKQDDEFHSRDAAAERRAPKGKKLPAGYKIVDGPVKGFKFVQTPEGDLIPNQGINAHKTEQDLIDNLYYWLEKQK